MPVQLRVLVPWILGLLQYTGTVSKGTSSPGAPCFAPSRLETVDPMGCAHSARQWSYADTVSEFLLSGSLEGQQYCGKRQHLCQSMMWGNPCSMGTSTKASYRSNGASCPCCNFKALLFLSCEAVECWRDTAPLKGKVLAAHGVCAMNLPGIYMLYMAYLWPHDIGRIQRNSVMGHQHELDIQRVLECLCQ